MWYLSQWHQRVIGWGHRNGVSSEGFEDPFRAATFTGVKHTSVHVYVCMTHPTTPVFPFSQRIWYGPVVSLDLLPFQIKQEKKNPHPELLIGLGLICNHHKGKERTLSCATAINNPETCIINHELEPRVRLLRWRKKEGMGKRNRFYSFLISKHIAPFWDHSQEWEIGLLSRAWWRKVLSTCQETLAGQWGINWLCKYQSSSSKLEFYTLHIDSGAS